MIGWYLLIVCSLKRASKHKQRNGWWREVNRGFPPITVVVRLKCSNVTRSLKWVTCVYRIRVQLCVIVACSVTLYQGVTITLCSPSDVFRILIKKWRKHFLSSLQKWKYMFKEQHSDIFTFVNFYISFFKGGSNKKHFLVHSPKPLKYNGTCSWGTQLCYLR